MQQFVDWLGDQRNPAVTNLSDDLLDASLVSYLLDEVQLPRFAFPLKLMQFIAEEYKHDVDSEHQTNRCATPTIVVSTMHTPVGTSPQIRTPTHPTARSWAEVLMRVSKVPMTSSMQGYRTHLLAFHLKYHNFCEVREGVDPTLNDNKVNHGFSNQHCSIAC